MGWNNMNIPKGRYPAFLIVFVVVTGALLVSSLWVLNFVLNQAQDTVEEDPELSLIYVDYSPTEEDYLDGASLQAMGNYIQAYPEPQNVQVLTGMTTQEIAGYMVNHVSAGLQVDCTYCHSLDNFAAEEWDDEVAVNNRLIARAHLRMSADLNQNWLTELGELTDQKHPSGVQIGCATCHLGVAAPQTWPEDQTGLPDDFRLPLDEDLAFDAISSLKVNAREDISLDTVQYNQQIMYHMNDSMGVGCTHCHNSRYFPSWEQPAKYYAKHMLQMAQYIDNEYTDVLGGQEPSCTMCHYNNIIPPGSIRSAELLPSVLSSTPDESVASGE